MKISFILEGITRYVLKIIKARHTHTRTLRHLNTDLAYFTLHETEKHMLSSIQLTCHK